MGCDVETIVAERAAVLSYARAKRVQISALVSRGRLTEQEGSALSSWIAVFADDVAIGLHRDGEDPAEVRGMMRALAQVDAA